MPNTLFHKSVKDFLSFNSSFLNENYYLVHPLLNIVDQHAEKVLKIESAFSIVDEDKLAIGLQCHPFLLLYSVDWNDAIFHEILKIIPFDKMGSNVLLSGTHALIEDTLTASGKKYEIISRRNVYECIKTSNDLSLAPGLIERAEEGDINRISELSWAFQNEEYGDRVPHTLEYMRSRVVIPGISNGTIIKWSNGLDIVSIAQVMIDGKNMPEIGHFFTDPAHRNKGYGKSLIWSVTNAILKDFEVCGLITNHDNTAANLAFQKVGYVRKYDWMKVSIQ